MKHWICQRCHNALMTPDGGGVQFRNSDSNGRPTIPALLDARFGCVSCVGQTGYFLTFAQLAERGYHTWRNHLRQKTWWCDNFTSELRMATRYATWLRDVAPQKLAALEKRRQSRRESFYQWLASQRRRNDPVGDLAREVVTDIAFPKDAGFVSDLEWFFGRWYSTPGLCEAVVRAWREYRRSPGGRLSFVRARKALLGTRKRSKPDKSSSKTNPARLISPRQRARILERDGFRCRRCGSGPDHSRIVVDHVVPVAMGGDCQDKNLQTLCEPCNQGKADSPPHEHDFRGLA